MKKSKSNFLKAFVLWILLAGFVTFICILVYSAVQQNYRQSAYDPQIQMSEDIADSLSRGEKASSFVQGGSVDIARSLAVFVIIYDNLGRPVGSTARLDDKIPIIPVGVLDYARNLGQDRLTWQPRNDARNAAIVTHFIDRSSGKDGFVLVGRSLREVEKREEMLTVRVALAWAGGVVSTFIFSLVVASLGLL